MKCNFYLLLLSIFYSLVAVAQNDSSKPPVTSRQTTQPPAIKKDTSRKRLPITTTQVKVDSIHKRNDSLFKKRAADSLAQLAASRADSQLLPKLSPVKPKKVLTWQTDTLYNKLFDVPYLPLKAEPVYRIDDIRNPISKDELFYVLTGVLFFLGLIRLFFPRYFLSMFRLFLQTNVRQKQTREQLLQDRLPSLLMNIFFILVGSVFIGLVAMRNNWLHTANFWWILLYCTALLAGIYLLKFIGLQFTGWVFNAKESVSTYSFIVFLINKTLGVALLPLLLLYAFSGEDINKILITITCSLVVLMLLYRYAVSLSTIRGNLKVSALHFFIYLCAVEIVPLILLYKVLFKHILKDT